ncbi:MAG: glycosyltransferase family 39 protein [candidate division Zixibacteria bacterium]|nr:glycosyltransferase family 39 protein [candidate division Zixibacteria bacterium]
MEHKINHLKPVLILLVLGFFFLVLGNGILSLTNPDEVFYVQSAKEMAQQHTWMTPYLFGQPQFEKPILTYWVLRLSFLIFGISNFGVRFFPAIFGILGVLSVYFLGWYGFKDEKKAFLSALILMSGVVYIGLARTVYTDMIFSIFILLSLVSFYWGYSSENKKTPGILLFFVFSGLAVLTKGPLGLLMPFLTVAAFLLIEKNLKFIFCRASLWGIFIFSVIAIPWYAFMIAKYGHSFTYEFFYNDHIRRILEAEHSRNDTWYFYPMTIVLCTFPWSLLTVASLIFLPLRVFEKNRSFHIFLGCWIVAVFLIFQFAHSKLVSYIFPLFPALALLTGDFVYGALSSVSRNRILLFVLLASSLILLAIPLGLITSWDKYSIYLSSKIPVYATIAAFAFLGGIIMYFIFKNKLLKSTYLLALVPAVLLVIAVSISSDLEPYLSSKNACRYLSDIQNLNGTVLCSKFFARGVKYYTGKEVAAVDINGTPFFSPHPIPFLDSEQKVRGFLRAQPLTYCIVRKSTANDIERLSGNEFKSTILKIAGDEYILKIEPASFYSSNSKTGR